MISTAFSPCTSRPNSSFKLAITCLVDVSIMSPLDAYTHFPLALQVSQKGSSRSLILRTCLGGITVLSNTCTELLDASVTQTSFSSGDKAIPWLGHPWPVIRSRDHPYPCTCTVYVTFPLLTSAIWNPSRSFTFA